MKTFFGIWLACIFFVFIGAVIVGLLAMASPFLGYLATTLILAIFINVIVNQDESILKLTKEIKKLKILIKMRKAKGRKIQRRKSNKRSKMRRKL